MYQRTDLNDNPSSSAVGSFCFCDDTASENGLLLLDFFTAQTFHPDTPKSVIDSTPLHAFHFPFLQLMQITPEPWSIAGRHAPSTTSTRNCSRVNRRK